MLAPSIRNLAANWRHAARRYSTRICTVYYYIYIYICLICACRCPMRCYLSSDTLRSAAKQLEDASIRVNRKIEIDVRSSSSIYQSISQSITSDRSHCWQYLYSSGSASMPSEVDICLELLIIRYQQRSCLINPIYVYYMYS